jgi:hypothetical protein
VTSLAPRWPAAQAGSHGFREPGLLLERQRDDV